MALTERNEIVSRNVYEDGRIQIRTDTIVERDGKFLSRTIHRSWANPGDDKTKMAPEIKRIADVEHTQAKTDAYKANMKALLEI